MTRQDRRDHGFTVAELAVVVLLLGIVSLVLLNTLDSLTRTTAKTEAKAQTLADARLALETIARDLRAANPIGELTSGPTSQYDTAVFFDVYCTSGPDCVNNLRRVTYRLQNSALERIVGSTTRTLIGPTGSPSLPTLARRGAVQNTVAFRYFDRNGDSIATSNVVGSGIPSTFFRDCTKRVRIELVATAEAGQSTNTIELATTVTLRNHNEVNPC